MSKHTKAPWTVHDKSVPDTFRIKSQDESVAIICGSEANANLIAAAPELLEALEIMVAHAPNTECETNLRVVIAKAKGETK